jgi:cysteinyl-tRNA synthetase
MNATRYPKVSDHLPQIIEMVEKLKQKGYAYQAGDSVYFRVNAFSSYNQFAAGGGSATDANVSSSDAVTSMEDDPYGEKKASFRDFALWKGSARARLGGPPASRTPQPLNPEAPSEAELVKRGLAWNSSLGCGRPGNGCVCS